MTLRRSRATQRRWRWFFALLTLFALFLAGLFFVLPPVVKSQAQTRLAAALHRPVTIGQVRLNPFTLALTVEKFEVREPNGREVFLSWDRFYASLELISFIRSKWKFSTIELDGPRLRVFVNPDGSLNFSDLLAQAMAPAPAAKTPAAPLKPVVVSRFVITGARLDFSDHSRAQPFSTTLGPVGFSVTSFHTVGSEQAPYSFEAVTESGEKLAWKGWVESTPFSSGGELSVSGLILNKYSPYYAEKLGVDLTDGRLSVRGRYEVSFDENARVMKLLDGSLALRNLKLVERTTGESLLDLPAADITGVTADGIALKAAVKEVVLQGGHLRLRREKGGTLNLASLIPPAPAPAIVAGAGSPAQSGPKLAFDAAEMSLRDWTIDVQDLSGSRPAELGLAGLNARLEKFSLANGAEMPFEVAVRWQPKGTVRALGTVVLQPIKADFKMEVESLGLLPLSPYLEQNVNARLADGNASMTGHATLALPDGKPPAATFEGDVWLEKFSLLDNLHIEELAGFSDLILSGIKASTTPRLGVSVGEVHLNAPYAHVILDRDKVLNVATLLPQKKTTAGTPAPVPAPSASPLEAPVPAPSIEVGRVVINGGVFTLADQSISPQVRLALTDFGGKLTGLSSENPGRGAVDLKATVGGTGPFTLKGRFDPIAQNMFVDAKIGLQGFELLPFGPYVGKYAGYELARGKLVLDISAKLVDRKVEMSNVITLNQFTFGRATNSPEATKLPVRFGVALLKDLDGKIILDVPVEGSFDDPQFRIGRVVWRAVGNLIAKAAASPFTFLGAMFGGGEELSWQEFAPGESALSADGLKKLETLEKALKARPGLNLGLEGSFDPLADTAALKQIKLADLVRRTIWDERHAKDPNIAPPEQIEISTTDSNAMIKKLFDRKFPPGTEFGTPLPPPPFLPPPEPESGNFLLRVYAFVTLKHPRELGAYRVAQQKAQKDYVNELKTVVTTGLPLEEMSGRLVESMAVTPDDLQALADARAQRVRDYLITEGQVASERLFLAKPAEAPPADAAAPADAGAAGNPAPAGKGARVFLTIQ